MNKKTLQKLTENEDVENIENEIILQESRCELSESFSAVGVSPLKVHALSKSMQISSTKRKLSSFVYEIKEKVSKTYDIPKESLEEEHIIPSDLAKKSRTVR